ncbi:hypothetical protein AMECASPLE_008108, partial [Ameca splendens]
AGEGLALLAYFRTERIRTERTSALQTLISRSGTHLPRAMTHPESARSHSSFGPPEQPRG